MLSSKQTLIKDPLPILVLSSKLTLIKDPPLLLLSVVHTVAVELTEFREPRSASNVISSTDAVSSRSLDKQKTFNYIYDRDDFCSTITY